ncbi:NAD-dependent epimerase/dehydratase family protein [Pseudomonas gingeri]|uniref:NAD-dependent epimerase/dehydratase family protein n=1 Tax=Pseudomonas gingeri TaxID=117681 RepID=A0A7Y7WSK4_9PSED|nr:NAD-dependent epimerase/dehydratase family protein [Pseudomonas gingeri]NWB85483.1 NAD-dependent epimerase/dehydratase family protein [Pseudomonas gingeri]
MNGKTKLLVTGGTGFVGGALIDQLSGSDEFEVFALVRRRDVDFPESVSIIPTMSLAAFSAELFPQGCDCVIHAAARVHVMDDSSVDPLAEYRKVNVDETLALASQAASAGVRRFVFISSIKVNGEYTFPGFPFQADDLPAPVDPYGVSKMEAEMGLRALAASSGMEVVIIRPVLVYGPGVKANFYSMLNWLSRGLPLPLGFVKNKRSLVAMSNLVDLIVTCIRHPAAANQIFLVSDGDDVSTTELLQRLGVALGCSARLLPIPSALLILGATMLGRREVAQRLCSSLQVDIRKNLDLLGWTPPKSIEESFNETALAFKQAR